MMKKKYHKKLVVNFFSKFVFVEINFWVCVFWLSNHFSFNSFWSIYILYYCKLISGCNCHSLSVFFFFSVSKLLVSWPISLWQNILFKSCFSQLPIAIKNYNWITFGFEGQNPPVPSRFFYGGSHCDYIDLWNSSIWVEEYHIRKRRK